MAIIALWTNTRRRDNCQYIFFARYGEKLKYLLLALPQLHFSQPSVGTPFNFCVPTLLAIETFLQLHRFRAQNQPRPECRSRQPTWTELLLSCVSVFHGNTWTGELATSTTQMGRVTQLSSFGLRIHFRDQEHKLKQFSRLSGEQIIYIIFIIYIVYTNLG